MPMKKNDPKGKSEQGVGQSNLRVRQWPDRCTGRKESDYESKKGVLDIES